MNPSSTATSSAKSAFDGDVDGSIEAGASGGNRGFSFTNNVAFSGAKQTNENGEPMGLPNFAPYVLYAGLALVGLILFKRYGSR